MEFPNRELEVIQLAQDMSKGLTANPEVFTAPPTSAQAIDEAIAAYHTARDSHLSARTAARNGTVAKKNAFDTLSTMLRGNLRYAEGLAATNAGVLELVGWAAPRKPVRNERFAPGQVSSLEVGREGAGWVALAWQEPFEGGTVAAYRVQRRRLGERDWVDVGTAIYTAVKLDRQETGVELEYQVIGVNAAGEGPASNIIRVVL